MKINPSGLPTPWPIILISFIISFISMKKGFIDLDEFEKIIRKRSDGGVSEKLTVSKFTKFLSFFALFRSIIGIIGSISSLIFHGISGFQYPSLNKYFKILNFINIFSSNWNNCYWIEKFILFIITYN